MIVQEIEYRLPSLEGLSRMLAAVFRDYVLDHRIVSVIDRQPVPYESTSPCEIVTCHLEGDRILRLLCKYAGITAADDLHYRHGQRGGLAYEAAVYSEVLQESGLALPRFYGAYRDMRTGQTCLVLEYLEESVPLEQAEESDAMILAARWIGQFHAAGEGRLECAPPEFLHRYDVQYILGWVRRTLEYASHRRGVHPWLSVLCDRFQVFGPTLLTSRPTIIHGEFYPLNILFQKGKVYPIDWESTATAAGQIDLATLTEGWPPEIVRGCELEYQQARWPQEPPADFQQALDAARLFVVFRWLGDRPEWVRYGESRHYFQQLRSTGERLGLI